MPRLKSKTRRHELPQQFRSLDRAVGRKGQAYAHRARLKIVMVMVYIHAFLRLKSRSNTNAAREKATASKPKNQIFCCGPRKRRFVGCGCSWNIKSRAVTTHTHTRARTASTKATCFPHWVTAALFASKKKTQRTLRSWRLAGCLRVTSSSRLAAKVTQQYSPTFWTRLPTAEGVEASQTPESFRITPSRRTTNATPRTD